MDKQSCAGNKVEKVREIPLLELHPFKNADCQPKRTPVPYSADSTRHN